MGTNYRWISVENADGRDIHEHIGKRSAAGPYCWDCGTTLCRDGSRGVHHDDRDWHDRCPSCDAEPASDDLGSSAAGVELGFAKSADVRRVGVTSCSSFSWTLMRHKRVLEGMMEGNDRTVCVVDEYGREYNAREFLTEELASVAIEFQCPYGFS